MIMDKYKYPNNFVGEKLIVEFGGDPKIALECQDWEYTYPKFDDLQKYLKRYEQDETNDEEKRVLAAFIFQACDDLLRENYAINEDCVKAILSKLSEDIEITKYEFDYWSSWDTKEKEHRFHISEIAREFKVRIDE